jgi:transcriptional regulator with XRE-family HTH domain
MADHTKQLRQLMKSAGISTFKDLKERSQVGMGAIAKLRRGEADLISYKDLNNLGLSLGISVEDLSSEFSPKFSQAQSKIANKEKEQAELKSEFQQEVLTKLESLLLQLPTAIYAISKNPEVPARNLLPLMRPIENLLQDWGIEAIARVGVEVNFDPRLHQPMNATDIVNAGDRVLVRYTGYVSGDRLLYRARVSKIVKSS